jgi:hypothetical protein
MQVAVKHRETSVHNRLNSAKQAYLGEVDLPDKSPAMRAQELLDQAKAAASEHIAALDQALAQVGTIANEIASGGEIYPDGVRDLCRRLNEEVSLRSKTMAVIIRKSGAFGQSRRGAEN